MKNIFLTIGLIGGISGCIAVAQGDALLANIIWMLSNPAMIIHNVRVKEHGQAWLWSIYVGIATYGIIRWLVKNA